MRVLFLDCSMGAAGDMLASALVELVDDPDAAIEELNALCIPGVRYVRERAQTCGIVGTHVRVLVDGEEEEPAGGAHSRERAHVQDHARAHHHHHHTGMADIERILRNRLALPERVRDDALAVFGLIAEAESAAHGVSVPEIHFHEVGTMDAVADVVAVSFLLNKLSPEVILATPVSLGGGQVACAHGVLPVPAPATAHILRGVPVKSGPVESELTTPTGAALLKHFVRRFGDMPVLSIESIGYGIGTKRFERANCVRALLGKTAEEGCGDVIVTLQLTVDDMTAEEIGFAIDELLSHGALEAFAAPIVMKKSRPGTQLTVMCREEDRDRIVRLAFAYTATIGIRERIERRYVLERNIESIDTPFGPVRKKKSWGFGVRREKLEYDDLARIARASGRSLFEVRSELSRL